jgi:hypothetical protein
MAENFTTGVNYLPPPWGERGFFPFARSFQRALPKGQVMFRYVPPTDNTHRPASETETASSAEENPAALPDHTGETSVEIIENGR